MVLSIKKFVFAFLSMIFFSFVSNAQEHSDLNNTFNRAHVKRSSNHKKIKALYKRPSKNRLYSNECVRDYTISKMGFEYVILTGDCEKALGNRSGFELELQNLTTEIGIFFTHGPFWKLKVKKRFKFCKERMGEFIE